MIRPDDLSPGDRELAQEVLARIYLGRMRRREWARQFVREPVTQLVRLRVSDPARAASDRDS